MHGTRPGQLVMFDGRGLVGWREDLSVVGRQVSGVGEAVNLSGKNINNCSS